MAFLGEGRTINGLDYPWLDLEENTTPASLLLPAIDKPAGMVVAALDTKLPLLVSMGGAGVVGRRDAGDSAIEDRGCGADHRGSASRDAAETGCLSGQRAIGCESGAGPLARVERSCLLESLWANRRGRCRGDYACRPGGD